MALTIRRAAPTDAGRNHDAYLAEAYADQHDAQR